MMITSLTRAFTDDYSIHSIPIFVTGNKYIWIYKNLKNVTYLWNPLTGPHTSFGMHIYTSYKASVVSNKAYLDYLKTKRVV